MSTPAAADSDAAWRDRILVERLAAAIERELAGGAGRELAGGAGRELPGPASRRGWKMLGFERDWWDGESHDPCLLVRPEGARRRLRVVETCGDTVVVPAGRRRAARELAAYRRRRATSSPAGRLADPGGDTGAPVRPLSLDATHDMVRCAGVRCGAMRDLDLRRSCPRCGH